MLLMISAEGGECKGSGRASNDVSVEQAQRLNGAERVTVN